MSSKETEIQVTDEIAAEFWTIFFDPFQSIRHFVLGSNHVLVRCDNLFVEAANRLQLLRTALDSADESKSAGGADYSDEDETSVSSKLKIAEDSELLPTGSHIVAKMDCMFLQRQCTEPSYSRRTSLTPQLRRTSSYDEPSLRMQVPAKKYLSDSAASSAYGSQDHSLQMSDQNPEMECNLVLTTPDDSDRSTIVFTADSFEPPQPFNPSLANNFSAAEVSAIPTVVAGWQLTPENEFTSVFTPGATDEQFVSATNVLEREQFSPTRQWELLQWTVNYHQQLYQATHELENRVIQQLLAGLLQENHSPEFVQSVAQALLLSPTDTEAVGKYLCLLYFIAFTLNSTQT